MCSRTVQWLYTTLACIACGTSLAKLTTLTSEHLKECITKSVYTLGNKECNTVCFRQFPFLSAIVGGEAHIMYTKSFYNIGPGMQQIIVSIVNKYLDALLNFSFRLARRY